MNSPPHDLMLRDQTTADKCAWFLSRLTPELDIYTVCVMARRDFERNDFASGIARLKVDSDKIRMHDKVLYDAICDLTTTKESNG